MVVKKTKKYRIEREDGLIDDCKYMLYMSKGWTFCGGEDCMPCKSIKEAMEFVREASFDSTLREVRRMAEDELILFLLNYTIGDEEAFDNLSKEEQDFFCKYIKTMKKKLIDFINKDSLAFDKYISKK